MSKLTKKPTFSDIEQAILDCSTVTMAVDDLYTAVGDDPFFEGMRAEHQDKIMNVLLGIKSIYDLKFDRTLNELEKLRSVRES